MFGSSHHAPAMPFGPKSCSMLTTVTRSLKGVRPVKHGRPTPVKTPARWYRGGANLTSAHDDYNGQIVKIAAALLSPGTPGRRCA
jgi:hypothetical protein